MPDGSGGIFTGLYWVATGKMPLEDLDEDEQEPEEEDEQPRPRQAPRGWGRDEPGGFFS